MPRRRSFDKTTLALGIMGGVMALEVVGYITMIVLGYVVPDTYISFMYSTLTVLGAVAGAQYVNGKTHA